MYHELMKLGRWSPCPPQRPTIFKCKSVVKNGTAALRLPRFFHAFSDQDDSAISSHQVSN